jgi:hypothetical protein
MYSFSLMLVCYEFCNNYPKPLNCGRFVPCNMWSTEKRLEEQKKIGQFSIAYVI